MAPPHTVLIIAHGFPPAGGAGVQRSAKFVKYLPRFGWLPVVLSASADAGWVEDPSLLAELPSDLIVQQVPAFSIRRLQHRWERIGLGRLAVALNLLLQLPDAELFWAMAAKRRMPALMKRYRPKAIYSSSGPASAHLLAMWAKRRYGLPWLADFRDPWSSGATIAYPPGYRALNRRIERKVLAIADRVVGVSRPCLEDLARCLDRDRHKFVEIRNGYDEEIRALPLPAGLRPFTLTHIGTFYRNSRPGPLIEAVQGLIRARRLEADAIKLRFVGRNARRFVPDTPPFEAIDYVPHAQLELYRRDSHALLLLLDSSAAGVGLYGGKLFEYLASNRPILAIATPGGVADRLLRETRTGQAVAGDPASIAAGIETLVARWPQRRASWDPNWDVIRRHTRERVTARLAAELDGLVS